MKCCLISRAVAGYPFYSSTDGGSRAVTICTVHNMEVTTLGANMCPTGMVEEATEKALLKLANSLERVETMLEQMAKDLAPHVAPRNLD